MTDLQPGRLALPASIRMGQMSVAAAGEPLRTLLGSCVGVALFDKRHQIGGLAHIMLPNANGNHDLPGKFVDTAIPLLIKQLAILANTNRGLRLKAKLAGGACMFATAATHGIGQQNIEASEKLLQQLRIPIVSKHCGGEQGRRMTLATDTGQVTIEIVGQGLVRI